ncbi:hypothetical protein PQX77_019679 [Marasmius sp. AFHP31]|nr:hypothetical protein PQX77_019679 [Marasmius sp. AFHP31]
MVWSSGRPLGYLHGRSAVFPHTKPPRLHNSYVKSILGLEPISSVYPACREHPLPPPTYESLSTSKPAGQQEAFSVLPSENPSPSPPNPPTSTVPLAVVQRQSSVLEITSNVTLSSSSTPTNSTHRYFAELNCDPRQKAPSSPPLFPITIFRRSKARNISSS